jgi:Zn-dependent peptidase ImmA (M78 family)
MTDEHSREDVHSAIDAVVSELLTSAQVTAPPVDAIALAQKHLGIVICLDRKQPQRGRAQRIAGRRQIYLRPEPTEERHQWTVAHEIGEHLKPDLLQRLKFDPAATPPMMGESLANAFAHRLLVPTEWLRDDARLTGFDLLELKTRYRTASHEVLAWRLLDLPEPCIITIVDKGVVYRRKSNAVRVPRTLAPAERACQRYVHERGEPRVVCSKGWTVQGWPVHQADWKREVLRSVDEGWFNIA